MNKTETVRVRVSGSERQTFLDAAQISGISMSSWMRERLRRAARSELEESGEKVAFLQELKSE